MKHKAFHAFIRWSWIPALGLLLLSGCGTCQVVERYNESYASGRIERCPEGLWVYNYDKIADKHQRYLITNYELIGQP